jgi:hypothetical protein
VLLARQERTTRLAAAGNRIENEYYCVIKDELEAWETDSCKGCLHLRRYDHDVGLHEYDMVCSF